MRQTISGETLKKKIYKDVSYENWLKNEAALVKNIIDKKVVYAKSGLRQPSFSHTYLNQTTEKRYDLIKKIFQKEHSILENKYPYLGDLLFCNIFDIKYQKSKNYIFNKSMQKKFISSIQDEKVSQIARYIFENASIEYSISVDFKKIDKLIVEQKNKINFKIDFDFDYFRPRQSFSDYKFIVIDGFIEKLSEINHALVKSYDEKTPYIIFCHGVNKYVKETILKNNSLGKTLVYVGKKKKRNLLNH